LLRRIKLYVVALAVLTIAPLLLAADGASFQGLGRLSSGDDSGASGVSDDGSVVVGVSGAGIFQNAFRWTPATGMQPLGTPAGFTGTGNVEISADGSTIAASFYSPDSPTAVPSRAYRWTPGGGFVALGTLGGRPQDHSAAMAVSADGSVIVGQSGNANADVEAFRWTAAGMTGLGFAPPSSRFSWALDVTPDGSTVVGGSNGSNGNLHHFRWTPQSGMVTLSEPPDILYSKAEAVSDDGHVVVGSASVGSPQGSAYRWTESGGLKLLRVAPGDAKEIARDVSGDGNIVVGDAQFGAFIWDPLHGMRSLRDVLITEYGLGPQLAGWTLGSAEAISSDGRAIVGGGTNPAGQYEAFLAVLPEPSAAVLLAAFAAILARRPRRKRSSAREV
jgi:probable HAF family extracellular repeat protein